MPRQIQYDQFVEPVSTAQENVTVDRWAQPQSQPYPARPYRVAACAPSFFSPLSTAKENVTEDRWHQPQSQPAKPVWRDDLYNCGVFWSPTGPNNTAATWGLPTNQPQRKPYSWATYDNDGCAPVFGGSAAPPVTLGWFQPWPQPLRKQFSWAAYDADGVGPISSSPENVSADRFVQPQSQPLRRAYPNATYTVASAFPFTTTAPIANTIEWFEPWAEPKRKPFAGSVSEIQPVSTQPENVTADRWAQPQSQPYLTRPWNRAVFASTLVEPIPDHASADTWLQPTSQPRLTKFPAATYASGFSFVQPFKETVFVDKWFAPWSVPVRRPVSFVLYDRYFNAPGIGQATVAQPLALLGGSIIPQLIAQDGSVVNQLIMLDGSVII